MKRILISIFCLLLVFVSSARSEDNLELLLKTRTLDISPCFGQTTLSEELSKLSVNYKKRYSEALPIFISIELTQKTAGSIMPTQVPNIDYLETEDGKPVSLLGMRETNTLSNVTVFSILRWYANMSFTAIQYTPNAILFSKSERKR